MIGGACGLAQRRVEGLQCDLLPELRSEFCSVVRIKRRLCTSEAMDRQYDGPDPTLIEPHRKSLLDPRGSPTSKISITLAGNRASKLIPQLCANIPPWSYA